MVQSAAAAFATLPLAQDAPQPHAQPFVQFGVETPVASGKVPGPASQSSVESPDNHRQTLPVLPRGLLTQHFLESLHAFLARPFPAPLEVPAQKVEPSGLDRK